MSQFMKQIIEPELLSADFEMVGEAMPLTTDVVEFNKHSMKDLDKVLDTIQMTPSEMTKLKQIIEASK